MSLRFDLEEGLIPVPVKIWGPAGDTVARLALDTGATASMMNWELLILLGYDPAVASDRIRVTTGSGVEFVPRILVDKVYAFGQERRNFPILCHTLPPSASVDGILGLDFFRGQKLVIDFRAGLVSVE